MSWISLFEFSVNALKANISRTILTLLGVMIGIGSVILITSLGASAEKLILGEVSGIGAGAIFIEPGPGDDNGLASLADIRAMTMKDVEALKRLPTLEVVLPFVSGSGLFTANENYLNGEIVGTTDDALRYDNFSVASGRFFTAEEARSGSRVAVIGQVVAEQLYPGQDPLGQIIKLKKANFTVIGVAAKQGSKFFTDYDKRVYIPYSAAQTYVFGINYISNIGALIYPEYTSKEVVPEIKSVLRDTRNLDNPDNEDKKDNFRVRTQEQAQEILGTVTTALQALLISVSAISLIVAGIGIMNIMLVSVIERTKEIGLRLAVGARPADVLKQFLLESLILTMIGAGLGLIFGAGLAYLASTFVVKQFESWAFALPLTSVAYALGVAFATGIIFGVYPAWKASRLRPIEALRFES